MKNKIKPVKKERFSVTMSFDAREWELLQAGKKEMDEYHPDAIMDIPLTTSCKGIVMKHFTKGKGVK